MQSQVERLRLWYTKYDIMARRWYPTEIAALDSLLRSPSIGFPAKSAWASSAGNVRNNIRRLADELDDTGRGYANRLIGEVVNVLHGSSRSQSVDALRRLDEKVGLLGALLLGSRRDLASVAAESVRVAAGSTSPTAADFRKIVQSSPRRYEVYVPLLGQVRTVDARGLPRSIQECRSLPISALSRLSVGDSSVRDSFISRCWGDAPYLALVSVEAYDYRHAADEARATLRRWLAASNAGSRANVASAMGALVVDRKSRDCTIRPPIEATGFGQLNTTCSAHPWEVSLRATLSTLSPIQFVRCWRGLAWNFSVLETQTTLATRTSWQAGSGPMHIGTH